MRKVNDVYVTKRSNTFEEQRDHFIERLKDRYEITIDEKEYDRLCGSNGIFHGVFSKQRRKTIGWVMIGNTKIWVLRDGELNRLATCYPPIVEHSNTQMMRACFGGVSRAAAIQIYKLYSKEAIRVSKMNFDSIKDAAIFFFTKTHFAPLHIDKYKYGSVSTAKVCGIIRKIICGESEHVAIYLRRIKKVSK